MPCLDTRTAVPASPYIQWRVNPLLWRRISTEMDVRLERSRLVMFRSALFQLSLRLILPAAAAAACLALATYVPAQQSDPANKSFPRATSQAEKMFSSYEGQNVSSVEILGQPNSDAQMLEPKFEQRAAQPFSLDKVNKTAENLKSASKFKEVRTQVDPAPNGVRVQFILEPAA